MQIHIFNQQQDLLVHNEQIVPLVTTVITMENQPCNEVSIYLVDTETICQLHQDFFQDPTPTDCISFPMDEETEENSYRILGEIFVCPRTAIEYASKHKLNAYDELSLYIIHALLHLMSYDDIEEEEEKRMREAEKRHFHYLQQRSLLLHS